MGCDQRRMSCMMRCMGFQSTHPCGVRPVTNTDDRLTKGFNPRTRVGCDVETATRYGEICVSIHAPVWGATCYTFYPVVWFCFNPRTRVGCDGGYRFICIKWLFQSTHPCGVRHIVMQLHSKDGVSIHAPVWGATIKLFSTLDS